jgi:hypothetical protein
LAQIIYFDVYMISTRSLCACITWSMVCRRPGGHRYRLIFAAFHTLGRGDMIFKRHLLFCRRSRQDSPAAATATAKTFLVIQPSRVRIAYLNPYSKRREYRFFDSPAIILNFVGIPRLSELFRHRKGTRCVPYWASKSRGERDICQRLFWAHIIYEKRIIGNVLVTSIGIRSNMVGK